MDVRRTTKRALLGVAGLAVVLGTTLGTTLGSTMSAEAAGGLPGVKAGSASHSEIQARAKVTRKGIPHRVGRAGLPG